MNKSDVKITDFVTLFITISIRSELILSGKLAISMAKVL
jgi:hypothetical protein